MQTYKDFNALGSAMGFTPDDLREMDTHTRITQHACYEEAVDEQPVVEISLEEAQRLFTKRQTEQILGIDPENIVGVAGVPDPIEVMQGLVNGTVKFVMTGNVAHMRIVRRKGFVAGRTTEQVLDTHDVNEGLSVSDVVDTLMRLAITRKLDTLPVYVPRYLNASWLDATGMELKPVLAHRGGRVQIALKAFKPAPVVPVSPEKIALQAENIARAVANAPLREAKIVEAKAKQKRRAERKRLKALGLLPEPAKKPKKHVYVDIMAGGSSDDLATLVGDGGSYGGGSTASERIGSFKNTPLSNFWPCKVLYDGDEYPSAECAFQAAKCLDKGARIPFMSMTSRQAKTAGRRVALRDGWNEMRVDVMRTIVRDKFARPPLLETLKATGSADLVEGNRHGDRFWGVVNGAGQNWLGRILMEIRDELRDTQHETP